MDETDLRRALSGRRVLVTGHTGFKGGWLCLWLRRLGAEVAGVSLPPPDGPSLYRALDLGSLIDSRIGDIRCEAAFASAVAAFDPEIVFHMAAQALVRESYRHPVDTFLTNAVGTAVVLDAARRMPSLRAAIVITSDKCYENSEWVWGYRETDRLGGSDPYSASKGCAELVTASYRRSFFADPEGPQLASARAGNVFGGGDWSADRLVPDMMRAALAGEPMIVRNPRSIRPWQHVLEPLYGYLILAARLLGENSYGFVGGWNFGPDPEAVTSVETLARSIQRAWGAGAPRLQIRNLAEGPHEAGVLRLDSTKARTMLGWRPRLSMAEAIGLTVDWYRAHAGKSADMRALSEAQIDDFMGEKGGAVPERQGVMQCA